jgi:hypothetical protein
LEIRNTVLIFFFKNFLSGYGESYVPCWKCILYSKY